MCVCVCECQKIITLGKIEARIVTKLLNLKV